MNAELRDVLELLEKATPGIWAEAHRPTLSGGYATEVFDADGHAIATLAWHSMPPRYEGGQKIVSTDRAENAAAIVAAVNFLRKHGEALSRPVVPDGDGEVVGWLDAEGYVWQADARAEGIDFMRRNDKDPSMRPVIAARSAEEK